MTTWLREITCIVSVCLITCLGPAAAWAHEPGDSRAEAELRVRSDDFHAAFNGHSVARLLPFCESATFQFDLDGDVMDFKTCKEQLPVIFEDQPRLRFRSGTTRVTLNEDTATVEIRGGFTSGRNGDAKHQQTRVVETWHRTGGRWCLVRLKVTLS